MASSLSIAGVHAGYGAVRVIEDVSIEVAAGETVALLGTNGNGKSTLMKCIMGMVRPSAGSIVAEIDGIHHDLVGRTTEEIVDLGIALVTEGRRLFPKLTVEENLLLGAYRSAARRELLPPAIPAGTLLDDVYWPLYIAMRGHRVVHDERAVAPGFHAMAPPLACVISCASSSFARRRSEADAGLFPVMCP